MAHPFSKDEYKKGIAAMKNNKGEDRDDVLVDQLKHLGQNANKWLHTMLNVCFTGNKIPKIWRQSKIIAILKPGKDLPERHDHRCSFRRPISCLRHSES